MKFSSSDDELIDTTFEDPSSVINSDEVEGEDEYEKHDGRVAKGRSGVALAITDSSELEEECKFLEFSSVVEWENRTGGLSATPFSNSLSETRIFGLSRVSDEPERERMLDTISEYTGGLGRSDPDLEHQLRIAVLRAKLGMTVEKSGLDPSASVGVKLKSLQTSTHTRSKVWPEETTAGLNIKELEMGQRNSCGGSFLETAADEDL